MVQHVCNLSVQTEWVKQNKKIKKMSKQAVFAEAMKQTVMTRRTHIRAKQTPAHTYT